MDVGKEHVVEAGERDAAGLYDYYYSYWLFSFRDGDLALFARSYDDEPQQAHFLRKEVRGRRVGFTDDDLCSPLFAAACDYLRQVEGKAAIAVLKGNGYEKVQRPTGG
jgi:hypothetical protein